MDKLLFEQRKVLYTETRLLLKDTPEAVRKLKRIVRSKDYHYVIVNDHIGDVVITLGFLDAFRKKRGIKKLALVVEKKFERIVQNYSEYFEKLITVDGAFFKRLSLLGASRYGNWILYFRYSNVTLLNPADEMMHGFDYFWRFPEVNLASTIKYGCFKLNQDDLFVNRFGKRVEDKGLDEAQKKKVLLLVDTRTVNIDIKAFYSRLVPRLTELGYEIYTNTDEDKNVVSGTKKVFMDLSRIPDFLKDGILIGPRNGLHDLFMYYDCKVIAIYPGNNAVSRFFSLKALPGTRADSLELFLADEDSDNISSVTAFVKGVK